MSLYLTDGEWLSLAVALVLLTLACVWWVRGVWRRWQTRPDGFKHICECCHRDKGRCRKTWGVEREVVP